MIEDIRKLLIIGLVVCGVWYVFYANEKAKERRCEKSYDTAMEILGEYPESFFGDGEWQIISGC